jgi:DNA ligase (NAD+)
MLKKYVDDLAVYLNERNKEYDEGHPTISDKEYDDKYFELITLEKQLNYYPSNSPTQNIEYRVVNSLEKVEHNHKMLSLEKTKDYEEVMNFVGIMKFIAMAKLDGLTCSLRYLNGRLVSAETRGNGIIGENILHNAQVISSIPKVINYKDELIIDGEIICKYSDFHAFSNDYKNPRNFAAGSIRLLDANECKNRNLTFIAWEVISGFNHLNYLTEKFEAIENLGFITVPRGDFHYMKDFCANSDYPVDGLVFKFDDIAYGKSLGETAHHFKNAIAYKFYDEVVLTNLIDIEWSMGRSGVLTPIAIFDTIEIDGTEINRASLHNVSVMRETLGTPYVGQELEIYKANMIIPQIYSARKLDEEFLSTAEIIDLPLSCPVCGEKVEIQKSDNNIENLVCLNPSCEGKLINKLDHFCGKKGLDIKGLSKATLEKLVEWGWVNNIKDIMILINHRAEWIKKPGFGPKSVDKILEAIEDAKFTTLESFISSLGIPLIGLAVSKELVKYIDSYEDFRNKVNEKFDFSKYEGFAESKTLAIWKYDYTYADEVYPYLYFAKEEKPQEIKCKDLKFVVTGKLSHFKNRDEIKNYIEINGGKVIDTVSKNTNYLINNDIESESSKNKTAKKLGVSIITEKDFLEKFM